MLINLVRFYVHAIFFWARKEDQTRMRTLYYFLYWLVHRNGYLHVSDHFYCRNRRWLSPDVHDIISVHHFVSLSCTGPLSSDLQGSTGKSHIPHTARLLRHRIVTSKAELLAYQDDQAAKSWRNRVIELYKHDESRAYIGIDYAEQRTEPIKRLLDDDTALICRKDSLGNLIFLTFSIIPHPYSTLPCADLQRSVHVPS
jgi:hypothetical protein